MSTSDNSSHHSSVQDAAELGRSDEDEPLLQMLLRQQEESMRLLEERYSGEMSSLRQEMNEQMSALFDTNRHSNKASNTIPTTLSTNAQNGNSVVAALDYNNEQFEDDFGFCPSNDVQLVMGTIGRDISNQRSSKQATVRTETNSWMYDLGSDNITVQSKKSVASGSRVNKTRKKNEKEEKLVSIFFGDNDEQQQKVQQTRRNVVIVDEEECIALKDHIKQQEERDQVQDDMIQLLETKIQQIENQGNIGTKPRGIIPGRYSIFRTFTEISSPSEDSDYFTRDTFTMMMLNKSSSRSWILGTTSFCFQMILGTMIAIDQFKASTGTSIFDVPFKVDTEVRIVQFLSIVLCLSIQSDVLTSIKTLFLLGRGSNWRQVIGIDEHSSIAALCGLWVVRIGVPSTMKLVQGLTVTFVSFVIIVQADKIIDLLKDFTALMIISETDNILYQLAVTGYLGDGLRQEALAIEQNKEPANVMDVDERQQGKRKGLVYVRLVFLLLLGGMFGGWGIIFRDQINGEYFKQKFPDCDNYQLALEHFGDGVCYGGTLNTIECKFEDGDCINFNTAYPNCKGKGLEGLVNVEDELGKGECNMDFAIPECDYDGGVCCPYNIQRSTILEWTVVSDCHDFILANPDCDISGGGDGVVLGNGICDGGGYTTEECGYEYGDCDFGQIGGDITLTGIFPPFNENEIFFNMKTSADGSMVFIEMPHTNPSGEYDRNARGRVVGYRYDSDDKRWSEHLYLEERRRFSEDTDDKLGTWTVNGDGTMIASGFPLYNDNKGRVDLYGFGTNGYAIIQNTLDQDGNVFFGAQVDMTPDGLRIALAASVPNMVGIVQVFQLDQSQQEWSQVGDSIFGKVGGEGIGLVNLRLNSSDGNRVFFTVSTQARHVDPLVIRAYELNLTSNQWIQVGDDIPSSPDHLGNKLIVSADGSRIVISSYSTISTRPGEVKIFDLITVSNERRWNQLGPTIFGIYSNDKYSGSADDGFGRDISLSTDGNLLAATSVRPSCDGVNSIVAGRIDFYTKIAISEVLIDGDVKQNATDTGLCATGSVQMYQYKHTNPPHRPFTLLPYRRTANNQHIMKEEVQKKDGTILGLDMSLSGDGSKLAVSGFHLTSKNGFVKVYNVADLFYVDCIVSDPEYIGDGDCYPYEPYYTEECGYDGGDCPLPSPVDGFDDCKVEKPSLIANDYCQDFLPYNSERCGYDGGDCPLPMSVDGYPNCVVSHTEWFGDKNCRYWLPYNSYDCGFDGGDCLPEEYAPTSSPSKSTQPSESPSISLSPTKSIQPSHDPSFGPSSEPSVTHKPSQS